MRKIIKIYRNIQLRIIRVIAYINTDYYMKFFSRYLKKIGVSIAGKPKFISPDVYFDGKRYTSIHLGDNVTISREVMFLTHDYSINVALGLDGQYVRRNMHEKYSVSGIRIGDNVFIGARVSILPNTTIGNNCIIGACSVVKGNIPDNSIVIGNPCKVIKTIDELLKNADLTNFNQE